MSPRRSAAEAAGTRAAIVERALRVGSVDGLEGLTIGRLAGEIGMSKSGLIRHFGSKEGLQLAALDASSTCSGARSGTAPRASHRAWRACARCARRGSRTSSATCCRAAAS